MRRLIVSTMTSLDGVMQAPGGREEDPTGGFGFGGWTVHYWGGVTADSMTGLDGKDRDVILGRKTYEIFEAYCVSTGRPSDRAVSQFRAKARGFAHLAQSGLEQLDAAGRRRGGRGRSAQKRERTGSSGHRQRQPDPVA